MGELLAIDPGNTESAYVVIDEQRRPLHFAKLPNSVLLHWIEDRAASVAAGHVDALPERAVIEMVASYGMPVGADVFETCIWTGRFYQLLAGNGPTHLVKRLAVKVHHCHDSKAKDANIVRALVDRFAPGASNYGKGTVKEPGWFHGFRADIWQAYALAVYAADTNVANGMTLK